MNLTNIHKSCLRKNTTGRHRRTDNEIQKVEKTKLFYGETQKMFIDLKMSTVLWGDAKKFKI